MKAEEATITGRTSSKGTPLLFNKHEMDELFSKWPDTNFIMEITMTPKKTSGSQIGYYKKAVIPALQRGWRTLGEEYTLDKTDIEIRKLSPVCHKRDPEEGDIILPVEGLTMNEMSEHIDFCIRTAAQEMSVLIPKPKN